MTRLRYLLGEAADNMRTNRTTTITALLIATFTMLGLGVFLLLYVNLQGTLNALREGIRVLVYLEESASPEEIANVRERLSRDPSFVGIEYVSREQALASFRARFPSEDRLLSGLGDNPFPASFVVKPAGEFRSSEAIGAVVRKLKAIPHVEEVLYNREWIERLAAALRGLQWAGLGLGTVLAVAMVTILANTIRLTLYARRDEIEILRLIGATPAFIKAPFVLEGALLGGAGALGSLVLLRGVFEVAQREIAAQHVLWGWGGVAFLPGRVASAMLILGLALGCLGSVVSLGALRDLKR